MIVETKHGQFDCKDITRKERRELYKKVKTVGTTNNLEKLHELADDFVKIAFKNEDEAEKNLGKLTALQEDEVLNEIIAQYMGLDLGNAIGD